MNQQDITTFLAIVHNKSFSKAADALFTSQTAVSHRIRAMEKELGFDLFIRQQGVRAVELTPKGTQFISLAEQWDSLWTTARNISMESYHTALYIGANERLNAHLLPQFYRSFSERTSDSIVLNIRTYHSAETIDLIDRRELDIGLVGTVPTQSDIVTVPFLYEPLVMICLRADWYHDPISPGDLDSADEVQITSNATISAWRSQYWGENRQPFMSVDAYALIGDFLDKKQYWSTCPLYTAKALAERFPIEIHPFSVDVPKQASYLIHKQHLRMDKMAAINEFLSGFQQFCVRYGESSPLTDYPFENRIGGS